VPPTPVPVPPPPPPYVPNAFDAAMFVTSTTGDFARCYGATGATGYACDASSPQYGYIGIVAVFYNPAFATATQPLAGYSLGGWTIGS
jgi:hypothetical protein